MPMPPDPTPAAPTRGPILAIDASNLIHRAASARPDLSIAQLQDDLARRIHSARRRVGARAVVAALDAPRNWREQHYPDYKAGRPPKPPLIREAFATAADLMRRAGARPYRGDDLEADDVLASMAARNPERTVILTSDRDLYAAVNERVQVLTPDGRLLGPDDVTAAFGAPPGAVALHKSLAGDRSDNIPGVPGIGVKMATQICMTACTPEEALREAGRHRYTPRINALLSAGAAELERWYPLVSLRIGEIHEVHPQGREALH